MVDPGRIVLLNGVGSAGKSSIARALLRITSRPFLHVQMDTFLDMMPEVYLDHEDGLKFVDRGASGVEIIAGPFARRVLSGMRQAVAAMAAAGNDLIVDDVLLGSAAGDYRKALAGFTVHWVGVIASLANLVERERVRGDRLSGLAQWQYERVHNGVDYNLVVDTDELSVELAAARIRDQFGL